MLNPIPLAILLTVKRSCPSFMLFARDRHPDPTAAQIPPDLAAAVALVGDDALGPQLGPTSPRVLDRSLLQQSRAHHRCVALPCREQQGQRPAASFRPQMDLGTEAALRAAYRLTRWVPPFAPAACWCTRITVPSTECASQSSSPLAAAWAWSGCRMRSQRPDVVQR